MDDSINDAGPAVEMDRHIFRKSLPLRLKLHETIRAIGSTSGESCLDIGCENSMVSHYLRKHGGTWYSAVEDADKAEVFKVALKENVHVLDGPILPFKDKSFDVVVAMNFLEKTEDDVSFISECNRILKPTGRLVVNVNRLKSWSFINIVRRMSGLSSERLGLERPGYTEHQLFSIMKDGFDVSNMRSYSRCFLEFVDAFVRGSLARAVHMSEERDQKIRRIYSVASFFYRLADQMDMFLLFSKGFQLVALAKRRTWRTRNTPILNDGRSISEAVLNKLGS